MRKQIRGLDQASANAQDGISAVQTAEGALNEVQDMLQRMNELAVQAANGTNSETDRQSIQDEIEQLTTEIDRVSETTKFNEAYLLKGDNTAPKKFNLSYGLSANPTDAAVDMDGTGSGTTGKDEGTELTLDITSIEAGSPIADQNALVKSLRDQGFSVWVEADNSGDITSPDPVAHYGLSLNGEAAKNYSVNCTDITGGVFEIVNSAGTKIMEVTVGGADTFVSEIADKRVGDKLSSVISAYTVSGAVGSTAQYYDKDGNAVSANSLKDYFSVRDNDGTLDIEPKAGKQLYDAVGNAVNMEDFMNGDGTGDIVAAPVLVGDLQLKLHVGADATKNNQITINLQSMSAKGLGVNGLKVNGADDSNALNAIETIKSALSTVSAQRSELGAAQNRLEHTIANLDNIVENTTSAESAIRDTDMAEEMVKYSKSNILAQAGQSMLAQANQSNQGVLSLLG
ncbi:MAG: hypothetical protein K2O03_01105 [Lachnospiraceae bacterium]|nr:hypothetical protein [Lachnospiraceae bacterium]